jgi:hypothetical protein
MTETAFSECELDRTSSTGEEDGVRDADLDVHADIAKRRREGVDLDQTDGSLWISQWQEASIS